MKTIFSFLIALLTCLAAFAQLQPVACYNFSGNLNEANGGTPLQAIGGTGTYSVSQQVCTKDSIYSWSLSQGLRLPIGTTFPKNNYTIEVLFKFVLPYPRNWQRIIDFNDNTLDQGLYTYQNNLQMYTQFTGTSNLAQPNTWFRLFVTRDAVTDSMKGYINNNLEIQLKDIQKYGVFWTNLILFKDDIAVQNEEAAGSIDYLRIYNVPLTKKQIDSIVIKSTAPNVVTSGNQTICSGQNVTISASGAGSYTWNNGSTASAITVSPTATTTYYVKGWNYLFCSKTCSDSDAVTITVSPGLTLTTSANNSICSAANGSATVNVSGTSGNYTYSWNNGQTTATATGLATGTYTVLVTNSGGCSASASVNVIQTPSPTVTATATATTCGLNNGSAGVNVSGGTGTYTYLWSNGAATATATGLSAGTYTLLVTDISGCTATASATINPSTAATVSFTASDTAGCAAPFCVNFSCSASNIVSYAWDFGDGSTSASASPNHCYKNAGTYHVTLTVTNSSGCTAQLVRNGYITVHPMPVADFAANPQQATLLAPTVRFTDMSSATSTWSWSFGETGSAGSTLQDPQYTYTDTGCFTVSLQVENQYGCKSSIEKPVCVKSDFSFFIPNAFTPNANGLNDLFLPMGSGIDPSDFSFMIYDRWGDLIWQTRTWGEGWDGRANNGRNTAQTDVYVWKCVVKEAGSGKKHSYVGSVTLVK